MAKQHDSHPKAYFDAAKGYQAAADRLLLAIEAGEEMPIRDATYFLYAHAVELILKACLLACGLDFPTSARAGHCIEDLYRKCLDHKLLGINDSDRGMINLIYFLGTGNDRHQYRYPDKPAFPRVIPILPWTREVVGRLLAEAEPHVATWVAANLMISPPVAKKIALGKPTYTKQAVPMRPGP